MPQSPTHSSAKLCCEMFLTDWAWDPARVTEGLAREATRMRTWRREVAIGGDVLFGLNVLRHLPPTVYESVIYYWMAWHLVEPARERERVAEVTVGGVRTKEKKIRNAS